MRSGLLALPAFAFLAACEKAVTVVSPVTYPDRPITEITVQFSPNFKPGTFHATLDGNDITALFAPAPAPSGQSIAQIPGLECGFTGGQTAPSFPPPGNRAVYVDSRPRDQNPSSGATTTLPPPVQSSSTTSPVPPPPTGLTVFWHRIVVDGDCSGGRICEGDERPFLPLHLVGVPPLLPITFGTPGFFEIETWPKASVQISVKVLRQTPSVTFNGAPSTSTVVPTAARSSPIRVDAVVRPSAHITFLCSPGVQRGVVRGDIR